MIEPNIHPVLVHFTYALLMTSAFSFVASSFSFANRWRDSLQHAADWMLFFGAVAVIATVAAGLQAYYSVSHDGPSHAAMTTHRNWAALTAIAALTLAAWRFVKRAAKPGPLFSVLLLAAAGLLTVTAWWGGKLVYGYGLGVKSMPAITGEGHDHEHGPGEEHEPAAAPENDGLDHDHGENCSDEPAQADSETAAIAPEIGISTPVAVVDAFSAALKDGDAATVERLLAPDVLIAEGGGAERSFAEYQSHHMPADMEFMKAVQSTIKDRRVFEGTGMATIVTEAQMHGTFRGKTIHSRMMETMALRLDDGRWRIAHIHWSSAEIAGEHEH